MFVCTNREPHFVGGASGPVNVLGSARGCWDDLAASPYQDVPTIACNVAGCFAPRLLHWVSMHRRMFATCMPLRDMTITEDHDRRLGRGMTFTHCWKKHAEQADFVWFGDMVPDTSGCFAAMLALHFGYSPIVLCGVPMDGSGRFHAPHEEVREYPETNDTWAWLRREHGDKIRSMSGRTREWFGAP